MESASGVKTRQRSSPSAVTELGIIAIVGRVCASIRLIFMQSLGLS